MALLSLISIFLALIVTAILFFNIVTKWRDLIKAKKLTMRHPMVKDFVIFLCMCALFGFISYDAYVMKTPTSFQLAVASISFLSLLFLYSVYKGIKKYKCYLFFLKSFWGTGAFLTIWGLYTHLAFIFFGADFLFSVPLFGAQSYIFNLSPSIGTSLFSICFSYVICYLGYLLGKMVKNQLNL